MAQRPSSEPGTSTPRICGSVEDRNQGLDLLPAGGHSTGGLYICANILTYSVIGGNATEARSESSSVRSAIESGTSLPPFTENYVP